MLACSISCICAPVFAVLRVTWSRKIVVWRGLCKMELWRGIPQLNFCSHVFKSASWVTGFKLFTQLTNNSSMETLVRKKLIWYSCYLQFFFSMKFSSSGTVSHANKYRHNVCCTGQIFRLIFSPALTYWWCLVVIWERY